MSDRDKSLPKTSPRAEREKRLAEALRANLRRRKVAAEPETVKTEPSAGPAAPARGKP